MTRLSVSCITSKGVKRCRRALQRERTQDGCYVFPELRRARQQIQTQHAQRMWSQAKAVKHISSRVTHWLVCVIDSGVILGDRMKVIVCVGCHASFSNLFSDRVLNEVRWVLIR